MTIRLLNTGSNKGSVIEMDLSKNGPQWPASGQSDIERQCAEQCVSQESTATLGGEMMRKFWGVLETEPLLTETELMPPPSSPPSPTPCVSVHNFNTSLISSTKRLATLNMQSPDEEVDIPYTDSRPLSLRDDAHNFSVNTVDRAHKPSDVLGMPQSFPTRPTMWSPFDDVYSGRNFTGASQPSMGYQHNQGYFGDRGNHLDWGHGEGDSQTNCSMLQQNDLSQRGGAPFPVLHRTQDTRTVMPHATGGSRGHDAVVHGGISPWHELHHNSGDVLGTQQVDVWPMTYQPTIQGDISPAGLDPYIQGDKEKKGMGANPKQCIISGCTTYPHRLARHLEKYHQLSPDVARSMCNTNKVKCFNENRPRYPSGRLSQGYTMCKTCGISFKRVYKHKCVLASVDGQPFTNDDNTVLQQHESNDLSLSMTTAPSILGLPLETDGQKQGNNSTDEKSDIEADFTVGNISLDGASGGGDASGDYNPTNVLQKGVSNEEDEIPEESVGVRHDGSSEKYKVDVDVTRLLEKVRAWACSAEGGMLEQSTLNTYISGCGRCIEYLGGTVASIAKYRDIGAPGGFIDQSFAAHIKARTTRVVIYGMKKLMQYFTMNKNDVFDNEFAAQTACIIMRNLAHSLKKRIALEINRHKVVGQDVVDRLIPKLVDYDVSEHCAAAKKIFAKANRGERIKPSEFNHIKAYLITSLFRISGHRTGVITNCLISQYVAAKIMSNNTYQIAVTQHKTAIGGDALITLPKDLFAEIATYLDVQRNRVKDATYLFATRTGSCMESGNIITAMCKALGMKLTVNDIRHLFVTVFVEDKASDTEMNALAKSMHHSRQTQEKYYDLYNQRKNSVEVYNGMTRRLRKYKVCIY